MTTRPRLIDIDRRLLLGFIPLGLFVAVAAFVLTTDFSTVAVAGFEGGGLSIVEDMGYAFIGAPELAELDTEDFLVALVLIAILLDAALDGALMLAKRDDGGER
ncbi:MAG: NADH-quinone oxidoreductase subunit J [Natronomonas sp.]|jgi:NADH-quinone oxidoreductase subunit J